jgi:hypothetical protein
MKRRYYVAWLAAMALAESGAAFDVSYHFGHVFDEVSIPHLTVACGVCFMVALLVYALYYRRDQVVGVERAAIKVAAIALAIGIADEPADLMWHLTFGIDITTWSPTHLMLNYPTDVLNIALVVALFASPAVRGRGVWLIAFGYFVREVMTTHFPLYQQEFGAVALDGLNRTGQVPWYVQPELLALAGPHARQLVTGGIPTWVYPLYFALAMCFTLTVCAVTMTRARASYRWPWPFGAATALAVSFLIWRTLFLTLFHIIHAAYPVVPAYLLGMGLVIDLTLAFGPRVALPVLTAWRPSLLPRAHLVVAASAGVAAGLALYAGLAVMQALHTVVPAAPLWALPFACVTGAAGAALGMGIATRVHEIVAGALAPAVEVTAEEPLAAPAGG